MEEVRSEDCKSESSSTSLLPLLHVLKLSRQKTGTKHFTYFTIRNSNSYIAMHYGNNGNKTWLHLTKVMVTKYFCMNSNQW